MGIVLDNLRRHIEKEKETLGETEFNNRMRAIDIFKAELAHLKEEILEVTAMKDVIKKAKKDNSYHEAGYFDIGRKYYLFKQAMCQIINGRKNEV